MAAQLKDIQGLVDTFKFKPKEEVKPVIAVDTHVDQPSCDYELRNINLTRTDADGTPECFEKTFIVHRVNGLQDTLFKLSYKYKVSKRAIQEANAISGEDIFFLKELLIPYRPEAEISLAPPKTDPEQEVRDEDKRRKVCIEALCELICQLEKKHAKDRKMENQNKRLTPSLFTPEAIFYLEGTVPIYDLKKAAEDYKKDLKSEIEISKQEKLAAKN